jgi:hypothetical protein
MSPVSQPQLSLILCSRNDAYMGNSRWRLETALNYTAARVVDGGRAHDVEILLVDWGSEVPLREVMRLTAEAARLVSVITVPPVIVRERQRDSPFSEALALNVAVRAARGRYIGRIDQDTLVGERFLRWFSAVAAGERPLPGGVAPEAALLFSNRRDIPYRLATRSPSLGHVTTFLRHFASTLPVLRDPHTAGGLYWTGSVGIWLAHRDCWFECGGFDERLIYYNWIETDMIRRLQPTHPLIDLGELTRWDFYHLEHCDPRTTYLRRPPRFKNAAVDLTAAVTMLHPNGDQWGLADRDCKGQPVTGPIADNGAEGTFASLMIRLAADRLIDRIVMSWKIRRHVWGARVARALDRVRGKAPWRWPVELHRLWADRTNGRIRRAAGLRTFPVRRMLASIARRAGLLRQARRLRVEIAIALDPAVQELARNDRARFGEFTGRYGHVVAQTVSPVAGSSKTALVVSSRCPTIEGELCTLKMLQMAGYVPVVLLEDERRGLRAFYEQAGVRAVHLWSEFLTASDHMEASAALVNGCLSVDEVMTRTHAGVRVGMIGVCTALRRLHLGAIDLGATDIRRLLTRAVATSMCAIDEAENILRRVRPDLVLTDCEYTPKGELFETCLNGGIDVIAQDVGHRRQTLMLKRYSPRNRDEHLTTLSAQSWSAMRDLEWTVARKARLDEEIAASYAAGDWFETPAAAEQHVDSARLSDRLGLDPGKKSAFVFPHVLWDAPVMWGKPLFSSYQEWFVETVAVACRNTNVNWVIKLHPAHVIKHETAPGDPETAESRVLRDHIGRLPSHIKVIAPDAAISTHSLFPVMDYCVTVRGTVGVEAARMGIPVLTAGPARYSELGFTVDSSDRAEYLSKLSRIEETPRLSNDEHALAQRFAYGLFVLRPLRLETIAWDPAPHGTADLLQRVPRLTVNSEAEWRSARDLAAFAEWVGSSDEDFMSRVD